MEPRCWKYSNEWLSTSSWFGLAVAKKNMSTPTLPALKIGIAPQRYVLQDSLTVEGIGVDGGFCVKKIGTNDIKIDNRSVIPYCPLFSKIIQAHINIEYCNSMKVIKYICKIVNKRYDLTAFGLPKEGAAADEIQQF